MEYITFLKAKAHLGTAIKSEEPVLSDEDEQFLNQITSDETPPPLPARRPVSNHGGDAQLALMDGAQNVALPPATPTESELASDPIELPEEPRSSTPVDKKEEQKTTRRTWNWLRRDSRGQKDETAAGLHDIAKGLKAPAATAEVQTEANDAHGDNVDESELKKEEEDMTIVLERLNLAAINNRVFSISDDTQELLKKFNLVLKDLMNGVPTAYNDLESLLTNSDRELQKTFNSLPNFLQKLIEKLPETMTKGIAPEMMAAAAERASKSGINLGKAGKAAGAASQFMKTPSLKDLVTKPGMVTGMLRSILQFLRTRFPAFIGLNVLWSLALFVLLFVFWYCHKRGKEVRLEKERDLTEHEVKQLEEQWSPSDKDNADAASATGPKFTTTTAPPGAPISEVRQGAEEVEAVKAAVAVTGATGTTGSTDGDIRFSSTSASHTKPHVAQTA